MRRIQIKINDINLTAMLLETPTADAIYHAIPIKGFSQIWGDEIYFEIPVTLGEEPEAKEEVEVGDLAFWPVGSAFCIFFVRTPVSRGNKPRAYSPVNVFGKIEDNPEVLKMVKSQSLIEITKL